MYKWMKYRLYPTVRQQEQLAAMLRHHCDIYNAALQERRDAYRTHGVSIRSFQQMKQLTELRQEDPEVAAWSSKGQQQVLRRLDKAFQRFFDRVKRGDKPGYPRFKSPRRFTTVDFRQSDGATFSTKNCKPGWATLHVKNVGTLKVRMHRHLPSAAKLGQVTVRREGSERRPRWFVLLPVQVDPKPLPKTGRVIGVDLGTVHLFTASEPVPGATDDSGHSANPRHRLVSAMKMAEMQRGLARCRRGSARRRRLQAKIADLHYKIRLRRLDGSRKLAAAMIRHADVLVFEDLRIVNIVKRAQPKPDGSGGWLPNSALARSRLSRDIHDAGWGVLLKCVLNKAEDAGREVVLVNPINTSRRCARCGHTGSENRISQALFACVVCGHTANADRNAALNILRAGTAHREAVAA